MIRILLCCGGGFSSSALSSKVEKEIRESNMQNNYYIEFSPFSTAPKKCLILISLYVAPI